MGPDIVVVRIEGRIWLCEEERLGEVVEEQVYGAGV